MKIKIFNSSNKIYGIFKNKLMNLYKINSFPNIKKYNQKNKHLIIFFWKKEKMKAIIKKKN